MFKLWVCLVQNIRYTVKNYPLTSIHTDREEIFECDTSLSIGHKVLAVHQLSSASCNMPVGLAWLILLPSKSETGAGGSSHDLQNMVPCPFPLRQTGSDFMARMTPLIISSFTHSLPTVPINFFKALGQDKKYLAKESRNITFSASSWRQSIGSLLGYGLSSTGLKDFVFSFYCISWKEILCHAKCF